MSQIARTPDQIGAILRRARRARGWTQADLGRKTKLRQATISKMEAGESTQMETFVRVLAALELEVVVRARETFKPARMEEIF